MSSRNAFVIGNGSSRAGYDLEKLRSHGVIIGCNALYRNFDCDYIVSIDPNMITEIESSDFPSTKCIFPNEAERWEPAAVYDLPPGIQTPRSNAGLQAIVEALRMGSLDIVCMGFDFVILDDEQATSNLFAGTDNYGDDTKADVYDTRRRIYYLRWLAQQWPEAKIYIVIPDDIPDEHLIELNVNNVEYVTYEKLDSTILQV